MEARPIELTEDGHIRPVDYDSLQLAENNGNTSATYDRDAIIRELREENALLAAQVSATSTRLPESVKPTQAPVLFSQMLAKLQWGNINKMSREQQAQYLQADPSVSDERLRELFGRNASAQAQLELQRSSPRSYAILKQFALCRRVYAN